MTTEQEDTALLLELEQKVEQRILGVLYRVATSFDPPSAVALTPETIRANLYASLRSGILDDLNLHIELTKTIGRKMQNVNY